MALKPKEYRPASTRCEHLNPYSVNQRGLYGTAASLLGAGRSHPSPRRLEFIEGLIQYINERPGVEQALVQTKEDEAWLTTRLLKEGRTAFKCAELLYALSAAPPAAAGRETLLRSLLERITGGHRPSGGWAADLDPTPGPRPACHRSIIRSLHAAGVAVDDTDLKIVQEDAADSRSVSRYVRAVCLYFSNFKAYETRLLSYGTTCLKHCALNCMTVPKRTMNSGWATGKKIFEYHGNCTLYRVPQYVAHQASFS